MKLVLTTSFIACTLLVGCEKTLDKSIEGKWAVETTLPINEKDGKGQLEMKCTSEYFPNRSVNHNCDMKIAMDIPGESIKMNFEGKARASGEWSVKEKILMDKTIDAKFDLDEIKINGEIITDPSTINEISKNLNQVFLKGETSSSKTISIDEKKWIFEQEIDKKKIIFNATRP
jgi:hypothetical protein